MPTVLPSPALFRHFIEQMRGLTGSVYGRRMYEVMRYWDDDSPDWGADERDFAAAWRSQPKWVVSRTLKEVGPNATLVADDLEAAMRRLKADLDGDIEVAGPDLADLTAVASGYLVHRRERLGQVRAALREIGEDATVRQACSSDFRDVCSSVSPGGGRIIACLDVRSDVDSGRPDPGQLLLQTFRHELSVRSIVVQDLFVHKL